MSFPFYVNPEQMTQDKAEFARKGIARGKSIVTLEYESGVLMVAENPLRLQKLGEIYDRIGFAGVGKYNEFDQLRVDGVRAADLKGYQFSRDDVDARSLANRYAQLLGQIFTHEMKPMEVEILVAEVGLTPDDDQLFHILYDGTVLDEKRFSVLGGDADAIVLRTEEGWQDGMALGVALRLAVNALAGPDRTLNAGDLEVAVLQRSNGRRCFHRLDDTQVGELLTA